jgi:hypothetical protein
MTAKAQQHGKEQHPARKSDGHQQQEEHWNVLG